MSTPPRVSKNTPAQTMKRVQQLHLWLGTLFAPLIIFFALSGALQTLGLHEREKAGGHTPAWIAQIASIHKNQQLLGEQSERGQPPRSGKPVASNADAAPKQSVAPAPESGERAGQEEGEAGHGPSPWPLKWFSVLMSLGLIVTTGLGIWMAFKYSKNKALVWGLLAAGILLPIVLLFL